MCSQRIEYRKYDVEDIQPEDDCNKDFSLSFSLTYNLFISDLQIFIDLLRLSEHSHLNNEIEFNALIFNKLIWLTIHNYRSKVAVAPECFLIKLL